MVLWRVAGPRINGVITSRRGAINGDIAAAQKARGDAEAASAAYQAALAGGARPGQALAEETRQTLNAEIAKAKAEADAEARRRHGRRRCPHRRHPRAARGHVAKAARRSRHRHRRAPDRRHGVGRRSRRRGAGS